MAWKLLFISVALLTYQLAADEETRLRSSSLPVQENEADGQEEQGLYSWLTEAEATPAENPSTAGYIDNELAMTGQKSRLSQNCTAVLAAKPVAAPRYSPQCYTFTGTSCLTTSCDPKLEAVCELGKCICGGSCTGADGRCQKEKNKLLAKGFTLSNVYWPKYKMYFKRVTVFGQMSTTKWPSSLNLGADKFQLYQLPGSLNGKPKFFLSSENWPDYVVTIRATTGTALSPWGTYAVKLQDETIPWAPNRIMVSVCSLKTRGYPNAIMIGSSGATVSPVWAYIHRLSSYVYGSASNPGSGGYWTPDPPLPEGSVPDCDE
eukprot:TRINITY_DN44292_c0_g1_i1.p1 TRINITY_DN44292_c0_g1~~TRINITY_DN44292_c0_g1_i1.p1  ORF type:complete len:319 (-),score=54.19 TRINITY_DN44292_c0_g1_i1:255-1211(-)